MGTLLTAVERVSWDEELYRGTIARELIDGLKAPLWDYQADPYEGGSLVVGMLAVPAFLLLGANLFALKLIPLGFSLAALILSALFLRRFFGRRAALLGCAFLILSPPVFTALSLSAIGSHPESAFFSVAMFFGLYQSLFAKTRRTASPALFGLISGIGCWFASLTLITLLTCLAAWFLLDRRSLWGKEGRLFLGLFGIGILPRILYDAAHGFSGLRFLAGFFLGDRADALSFVARLLNILKAFPLSLCFRPLFGIPGEILSLAYLLAAMLLMIPFLWSERRRLPPKCLPFLLYPLIFFLAYGASNRFIPAPPPTLFEHFRFFSVLYCLFLLFLSVCFRPGRLSLISLCLLLGLGAVGQGSLLFREPFGRALRYQGYSTLMLGSLWGGSRHPFPEGFARFQSLADRFEEPRRRYLYWGLSNVMAGQGKGKEPVLLGEAVRRVPPAYRSYFLQGWGRVSDPIGGNPVPGLILAPFRGEEPYFFYGLAEEMTTVSPHRPVEETLRFLREKRPPYPELFYFCLGGALYDDLEREGWDEAALERLESLGREEKAWVCRGMGESAAIYWVCTDTLFSGVFSRLRGRLSPEDRSEFYWGIGWGLREPIRTMEDRARALDWLSRLPEGIRPRAREGLRAFESWYGITPPSG
ncbi:MAG: hypothetical protein HYZ90_04385 [Candidatus Omnitrophica bacterium]|nr:hypothetical protein [Candidatus Omnitrophota bacterium]